MLDLRRALGTKPAAWARKGVGAGVLGSPLKICAAGVAAAAVFAVLRIVVAAHGHVGGLVIAGSAHVSATSYTRGIPVRPGTGYDGQFYYRMALDPFDWHQTAFGIRLDTLGRLDRVAYPAVVWLVSAGQPAAMPTMMVVVNLAALGALAGLCAALSRQAGRHPLWGLLLAGFFGFLWTLGRDLTELTEAVFAVAGLVAVRAGRPVLAGLVLSVAVLAREPALIVVGALCLARVWALVHPGRAPSGAGRDGGALGRPGRVASWRADMAWVLPAVAFAAWQLALLAGTGIFPARTSSDNNAGLPFVGLADSFAHYVVRLPHTASLVWLGELGVLALVGTMATISLRQSTAAVHERIAWVASAVLAVSLTKGIWLGDVGFRSFNDLFLLSGVLLLFSRLRLDLAALAVAGAWCVVAVELVLFI